MAGDAPTPSRASTTSHVTATDSTSGTAPDVVEISVPLRSEYGATLRTLAASLGADVGFTVDDLDDLRLALSEVFSVLVDLSPHPQARGTVSFSPAESSIAVVVAADDELESPIELDELAASILGAVVDEHEVAEASIRFVKRADAAGDDASRA